MVIDGWTYYNRAAFSSAMPHEEVDLTPLQNGDIWKMDGAPILARWTTDYDCGEETNWWYIIKDTPFDLQKLNAKRRYETTKGLRNFDVREINLDDCRAQVADVIEKAFTAYPANMRPRFDKEAFIHSKHKPKAKFKYYAAFDKETGVMAAYAAVGYTGKCAKLTSEKSDPAFEKAGVNAAIMAGLLEDNADFLSSGGYICDGARNVLHGTAYQDYLEKYFGFRKAYCRLHVVYKKPGGCLSRCCIRCAGCWRSSAVLPPLIRYAGF